ncbi:hypothetical protein GYMLUDRAFT_338794 [Collybiopsis luxurians FD-317 M1]|nr:hypothetical protein GYMLUDRAFT_338794 [Collybiopsis luxurians FD-317 M1]
MSAPFIPPPPSLALEFQLDFHLLHNPTHPVVVHPLPDGTLKFYTYSDLVPRIHKVAHHIHAQIGASNQAFSRPPVVAILATLDSFTSFVVIMGILRAGMIAFPISPRFSSSVVAHLINAVQPSHILINDHSRPFVLEVLNSLQDQSIPSLVLAPSYELIFAEEAWTSHFPEHTRDLYETAYVIHSSSSSALFPKTIHCSSHFMLKNAEVIDYAPELLAGQIFGLQGLELFHFVGLAFLNWVVHSGFVMAMLDPREKSSMVPASPNTIYNGFLLTKPSYVYASPTLIETWACDPKTTSFFKSITAVITAGKRLNKGVGDSLAKDGVCITVAFGSTETGAISIISEDQGKDWEYFYAPPIPEFKFLSRPDGFYTLLVLSTPNRILPVCNTTCAGIPAYDPGDIFMKHPVKEGHYCVIGRSSDQIMLSSGEMVNPVSIEEILCRHLGLKSALLFGHGRKYLGVLVQPSEAIIQSTPEMGEFIAEIEFGYN